jgi:radical SAM protein with 4Fe4S-binding SPASM domain
MVKTPLYVHWLATYDCNLQCRHCEAGAGERSPSRVSTEHIVRAVREMGRMGVRTLIVTGGEPLLRDDLFDVISLARKSGLKKFYLATNGGLVAKRRAELEQARLDRVYINLDGLEETHDELRAGRGAFRHALEALLFFKDAGVKERVINTVVHPGNIHQLESLEELVRRSGGTQWNIQTGVPRGRGGDLPGLFLEHSQVLSLLNYLRSARRRISLRMAEPPGYLGELDARLRPRPFFCGAGRETCSIMPDGEVLGCHVIYDNAFSAGNIKHTSFRSLWTENQGRFKFPEPHEACRNCKSWRACRGGCWAMRLGPDPCLLVSGRTASLWPPQADPRKNARRPF